MRSNEDPAPFPSRLLASWITVILGVSGAYAWGGLSDASSSSPSQQPAEPIDITPLDGEIYYVLNQLSGLQADLNNNSTTAGDHIVQQQQSFTNLSQRWAFTRLSGGFWQISNILNGLCFDSAVISGLTYVVQNPCTNIPTQQWALNPTSNGYYTISNRGTGLLMDLSQSSVSTGAWLDETAPPACDRGGHSRIGDDVPYRDATKDDPLVAVESRCRSPLWTSSGAHQRLPPGAVTQSQQWLLRPAFFRGIDNALLEKQEAARAAIGLTWWKDAGQQQDVLEIFKNHGVNMVRLRPTSVPPYANASGAQCSDNACYAGTDAQDLDLAKRARNLGMSIELTLLFDGGNSSSVPSAWAADTELAQLQPDLSAYVQAEILSYRQAGVMPDLVAIGNEVDTGFLAPIGSPTGQDFQGFAALQATAIQAVKAAAADTSIGPAIPPPLICIHITPAWDLAQFFTLANEFKIPYDAICQSYYPMYHGPLTDAQDAASNPKKQPIEQEVLVNAANAIGKPIFIIETGEHYENGFDPNDPWYAPPTTALQRQFLLDLQGVEKALPNNLGMGFEYWDPAGVNIPNGSGGFINGDNRQDAIYVWNGLTLFDNADASGSTNVTASNYSALLPGIDALGGKLDPTLSYKFVNLNSGEILSVFQASSDSGALLDAEANSGNPTFSQQWRITSNDDGYFQIASLNPGAGNATNVLDDSGGSPSSGNAIIQSPSGIGQELEWNVVSAGNGYFTFVNRVSGLALGMSGGTGAQAGFAVQEPQGENSTTQQWQIIPVH